MYVIISNIFLIDVSAHIFKQSEFFFFFFFALCLFSDDVKRLILSWIYFFKKNWFCLFNIDKEMILNLEFFLDTKKLVKLNAPPNNEVFLHELKKNPEVVLKFIKVSLHLLLCKFLGLDKKIGNKGFSEIGREESKHGELYCGNKRNNRSDMGSINSTIHKKNKKDNMSIINDTHMNSTTREHCFIREDEIEDIGESDDVVDNNSNSGIISNDNNNNYILINELKCDRYKDSEIFRTYFESNRITVYLYNWNKINKFKNLKSEKVNQLVCLRGSILRVSPVQLLITKLEFICEKCHLIFEIEFIDGKYDVPKKCFDNNCDSRNFQPIRESGKSIEYQKITLKENKKALNNVFETTDTNSKNLTVTLEVSKFFVNTCVPGNYVEALGILKVISNYNNYLINGKNSLFNMYVDCLSIFSLSSKNMFNNNNCFNIEKVKQKKKKKIYSSTLWDSYIDKVTLKSAVYANVTNCKEKKKSSFDVHQKLTSDGVVKKDAFSDYTINGAGKNDDEYHIDNKNYELASEQNELKFSNSFFNDSFFKDEHSKVIYDGVHCQHDRVSGVGPHTDMNHVGDIQLCTSQDILKNEHLINDIENDKNVTDEKKVDEDSMCMFGSYVVKEKEIKNLYVKNMINIGKKNIINPTVSIMKSPNSANEFDDKVLEFIKDMHNIYKENKFYLLVSSFCPRVIMNEYIKAGLLLSVLGGKTLYTDDKEIKRRGNIHNLLIGDPGLGKSRMLQYISNLIENSI
uniref:DNA helicase MCM8 n=1 Tax=Piliocolobus tephrosceles TaxID=591936 RepID=A0A8C9H4C3_9PRIM